MDVKDGRKVSACAMGRIDPGLEFLITVLDPGFIVFVEFRHAGCPGDIATQRRFTRGNCKASLMRYRWASALLAPNKQERVAGGIKWRTPAPMNRDAVEAALSSALQLRSLALPKELITWFAM